MKNRICLLIILTFTFTSQLFSQEIVTNFESGINLVIMEKTIPATSGENFFLDTYIVQRIKSDKIVRVIADKENEIRFGYKISIVEKPLTGEFDLTIDAIDKSDVNISKFDDYEEKSLKNIPSKVTMKDGDTIVLDILENPKTHAKIQDLIMVTREKKTTTGYFSELLEPKDFTINDLTLQLVGFHVLLDGKLLEKELRTAVSQVVGLYIKGLGTFVLSSIQDKGGKLTRFGVIDDNEIIIKNEGKVLRIKAASSILGKPGKWNLWGRFERETEKEKKRWDVKTDSNGNSYVVGAPKFIYSGSSSVEKYFAPERKGPVRRRISILRFDN